MEVCDSTSASNCFHSRPYLRQPYDLSPAAAAAAAAVVASAAAVSGTVPNVGLRFAYPSYPKPNSPYGTPYNMQSTTPTYMIESNGQSPRYKVPYEPTHDGERDQQPYNARTISHDLYGYSEYTGSYNTKSMTNPSVVPHVTTASNVSTSVDMIPSSQTKSIQAINDIPRGFCLPWSQLRSNANSTVAVDVAKNVNTELDSMAMRKPSDSLRFRASPGQIPAATSTDFLLHHAQSLSQWDVNDPKLPKIRQFDTFTMWPQGHCRYAYQKSASEGARRHASGWAMRNTNNHNAQILKKSCLGVLLCTVEGCPLAMRPAICDKARRRQEGRPCCMPNCTGRIYNQPCRGHGGYPVTHFWREHGDTVYFQSKGTHDHVRPDLKPVRDTAARRRRQMQLEKLQQTRTLTAPNESHARSAECFTVRGSSKTREVGRMAGLVRKRVAERAESKLNDVSIVGKTHPSGTSWASPLNEAKIQRTTLQPEKPISPSTVCSKPEPIFPSSPALGSYSTSSHPSQNVLHCQPSHGFDSAPSRDQHPFLASIHSATTTSSTHYPFNGMYSAGRFAPHLFYPRAEIHSNQTENGSMPNPLSSSFMKELLYEEELRKPAVKSAYQAFVDLQAHSGKTSLNQNTLQPPQPTLLAGPNSESTSGGLNASWSTPSPPTGGNSSLFGASELRNVAQVPVGMEDSEPKDKVGVNPQTWQVDSSCYPTVVSVTNHLTSPTRLHLGNYGLSTPTHPTYGIQPLSALESPDSLVAPPSILMSSSTPLSNGSALVGRFTHQLTQSETSYPTGYITPIPFYLNGSDSRSTRTSSSSGEATSQESGPVL